VSGLVRARRIELWVEFRDGAPAVNPVMRLLLEELAREGAEVRVRVPEREVTDPGRILSGSAPDLVLLKSATSLALSHAAADERTGVAFLNHARASIRAHDKAAAVARLAAAGLPVPPTFLQAPGTSESGLDFDGDTVSKPVRGVHGQGVVFGGRFPSTATATGFSGQTWVVDDGTRLIQKRIGAGEADLKVYVAGRTVFSAAKVFAPDSYRNDHIQPLEPDARLLEIVHGAGEALGLRCFGVDLRHDGDRPVIIDANPFPGYRGFPAALAPLKAEIESALR
jgi:ribosomal protein S6--L-glutamate ligase